MARGPAGGCQAARWALTVEHSVCSVDARGMASWRSPAGVRTCALTHGQAESIKFGSGFPCVIAAISCEYGEQMLWGVDGLKFAMSWMHLRNVRSI